MREMCCVVAVVLSEVGGEKDVVGYVFGVDGLCLYVFNGVRCGIWVFFGNGQLRLFSCSVVHKTVLEYQIPQYAS